MSSQIDHLLTESRRFAPPAPFAADAVATADLYDERGSRPRSVLGRSGARAALAHPVHAGARLVEPAVRDLVRRR